MRDCSTGECKSSLMLWKKGRKCTGRTLRAMMLGIKYFSMSSASVGRTSPQEKSGRLTLSVDPPSVEEPRSHHYWQRRIFHTSIASPVFYEAALIEYIAFEEERKERDLN